MIKVKTQILPLICTSFFILFQINEVSAGELAGKITVVKGTVKVKQTGIEKPVSVNRGDRIFVGDLLNTGESSSAQVTFIDDSFVNLSSKTAMRVNQYIFEPETNRRRAVIKVLDGVARFIFHKGRQGNPSLSVEAGNALITANTADFAVKVSPLQTDVAVLDREVSVKNVSSLTIGEMRIGMNQKTSVKKDAAPLMPDILLPLQRRTLIKETSAF